jgi:ketosteroid isomerase-like protein
MPHGTCPWFTSVVAASILSAASPARVEALQAPSGQAGSPASSQSGGREDTQKVIADLERRWDDAVRLRDTETLKRLMADDFLSFSPFRGSWNARKDAQVKEFADLKAREQNVTVSHDLNDTTINVTGDTAIATGRGTATNKGSHWHYKERGRFIHVWQKRAGEWLMVGNHWDSEGIVPPQVSPAHVDSAKLDAYAGKYDGGWPDKLAVTRTADGLLFKVEREGGWTETFLSASSTEFFGKDDPDTRAIFVRDDAGRITEVITIFHGRAMRARKLASGS